MPSQPPPDSTGGSPRTSAPFQSAPGSTARIPQTPAALSAQIVRRIARKCTELVDWWLERVEGEEGQIRVAGKAFTPQMSDQMRKGASSSNMNVAGRVFRSSAIVKHHDCTTIESEDGCPIRLAGPFNIAKTRENGFSEKLQQHISKKLESGTWSFGHFRDQTSQDGAIPPSGPGVMIS